jgi:hypothetical protein
MPRNTSPIRTGRGSGCAEETPGKYESYVDLEAGKWTRIRIEVQGASARDLFVHGQSQPTLGRQ